MTEETTVVNQGAEPAESTTANEQVSTDSEVVNTQETGGKDYKALYENAKIALQREREAKKLAKPQETAVQVEVNEDETVRRFIKTEALTMVNNKMLTDTTFKDRAPIVSEYIEQGYSFDMADKLAKADIMDKILAAGSEGASQTQIPKQITPTAIPEPTVTQRTGNVLDDIEKGLVDVDPALAATIAKYRNKG